MHLSEGVLHSSTLLIGAVGAVLGLAIGLKKMTGDKLALTALFSAAFFVASTIHIPVGIGSVHLILNGIAGLFLGWRVFPAFLIALTLQALMFSFGGLAVLGVNLCIMALPAVVVRLCVFPWLKANFCRQRLIVSGILSGVIGVGGAALLASCVLAFDGSNQYHDLISLLLVSHLPVFVVDSLISVGVLLTLAKMLPSAFENAE
ncbi:cobalt transporter CbiM [Haemophilus sputorum]|jgi:cobalt uptake substrate-specific transmembrane region|uniref:Cobalt transporter CbiM n=1 Tax=Haemophilus sputorum TaxID=1078480 RepID=A0ABX9HRT1_9PAST|nr:cobalt transporter CbiM [Haemophilus sputorum]EJP30468.1 cobalt uptake substrate-specific transmembrane region [Haemophilus sputorum HK 2154]MCQ1857352.1 cobalt transporter CbiM [Haemophilus sputorum]RDF08255.1 cobalt transporter CbiM [Haemophilus sputorum]RDF10633.1 cobalt transporter CbiM [Haemophilus sputorum]